MINRNHLSCVNVTFLSTAATQTGLMTPVESWMVRRSIWALGGTSFLYWGTVRLQKAHT